MEEYLKIFKKLFKFRCMKKNIKKLKIKFKIDKDCIKIITKLSTPKNNS